MKPEDLAKANTEHAHQRAFMQWCLQQEHDPRLKFVFAIPNGGERNKAVASKLKAEGVKRGVPDVFVPIPVYPVYHGLWIEFKRPKDQGKNQGRLSNEQELWACYLVSQDYCHKVVYTYLQAIDAVLDYLRLS